jgi:hypothetical protein
VDQTTWSVIKNGSIDATSVHDASSFAAAHDILASGIITSVFMPNQRQSCTTIGIVG